MIPQPSQRHTERSGVKNGTIIPRMVNRCKILPPDEATPGVKSDERHQIYTTSEINTGALSITDFIGGNSGQIITIVSSNPANKTTIVNGGNLKLANNWLDGNNKTLTLLCCGRQTWREIGSV